MRIWDARSAAQTASTTWKPGIHHSGSSMTRQHAIFSSPWIPEASSQDLAIATSVVRSCLVQERNLSSSCEATIIFDTRPPPPRPLALMSHSQTITERLKNDLQRGAPIWRPEDDRVSYIFPGRLNFGPNREVFDESKLTPDIRELLVDGVWSKCRLSRTLHEQLFECPRCDNDFTTYKSLAGRLAPKNVEDIRHKHLICNMPCSI